MAVKRKPAGSKRNRIIGIYILGVVLPGLVLGYMAFRGIQSDEALREKQTRQELSLVSQDFFQLLHKELSEIELLAPYASLSLEKLEELIILSDKLLFLPDEFLSDIRMDEFGLEPDRGWELEFVEKNLPGASAYYRNVIDSSSEQSVQIKARMSLARILRKQEKLTEALDAYLSIIQDYREERMGQIPVGLAARLERTQLYQALNNHDLLLKEWTALSEELLHPKANYNHQSFDLFYSELLANQGLLPKSDSLISLFTESIDRTEYLNKFLQNAEDYLGGVTNQKIYLRQNGYRDLLIKQIKDSLRIEALLLNLDSFFDESGGGIITQMDPDSAYSWSIKDEIDSLIFCQVHPKVNSFFSMPFPPPLSGWQLELQVNPRDFFQSIFQSGKGFYVVIFSLLAIWLILGLLFTVYMLNQEIQLSRMKSRFISNVSHEFKSPVTSIRHMSELLKLKRVRTNEKKEEFYDSMIDQCDHLSHLIENIMDFSKIEDEIKKYHFEPIRIDELVGNLVQIHKNRLSESGIDVNYQVPENLPSVWADQDALRQVVYNLLDNAYKYGSEGLKIGVKISLQSSIISLQSSVFSLQENGFKSSVSNFQNEAILVSVRDWGKGISKKDLPFVFDRFYRGDPKKTEGIKGSGIGLTIVKRIVEAHGGRIEVESMEGKGSMFTVFLPVTNEHDKNSDH